MPREIQASIRSIRTSVGAFLCALLFLVGMGGLTPLKGEEGLQVPQRRHPAPLRHKYGIFSPTVIPPGLPLNLPAGQRIPAAPPPAAPDAFPPRRTCMTDLELLAQAALRLVLIQEGVVRSCDPVLKLRNRRAERLMTHLHDEIVEKFYPHFQRYQLQEETRFKRWYGKLWKQARRLERRRAQQEFFQEFWLLPGSCAGMRKEMELVLHSGWHYLKAKIDYEAKRLRPLATLCSLSP